MKTVLITGASSGIGREFAEIYAEKGYNLVITARRKEKLKEIKEKYPDVKVDMIVCDLSLSESPDYLYETIKASGTLIDILINNAGFGLFGEFKDTDPAKEEEMIDLNIQALVKMTKLFMKDMVERNSGKILNVASMAAFQPGPLMSVYYATKAFVLSFSQAVRNELRNTNVTISTLCPGPTVTEFEKSAELGNSKLFSTMKPVSARDVALIGYRGLEENKSVIIPGFINKLTIFFVRFIPRNMLANITRKIQEKKN